jgi:glycosyltransferase involved in cell wall biosynthesis
MQPAAVDSLASVVIPTYNRAALLDEALGSVVRQSYRPIEILIVDDGSSDNTAEVVARWRQKFKNDPALSFRLITQLNSGVSSARNHGLIESTGSFIQFLDSDDYLHSEKLRLHIDCLARFPEAGLAFSEQVELAAPADGPAPDLNSARLIDASDYWGHDELLTLGGVYRRRTCYLAGPWSQDLSVGEDKEYVFRALLVSGKIVHLPGRLAVLRRHTGARLTDSFSQIRGLPLRLRSLDTMSALARSENCFTDPRLTARLEKRYALLITDALRLGERQIATNGIRGCRALPIRFSRRVSGRAKPATEGRAKTSHFEAQEIRSLPLVPGSNRETTARWRISSKWRKFKQFFHLHAMVGPTGTSPASLAFTARRLDAISGWRRGKIQNRPARPSARRARPPGLSAPPAPGVK